jgi:hypothetical protein
MSSRKPCTGRKGKKLTNQSLFGWLVADGWCWFVLREEYCWLVAGGWFVVRERYCWLVADKPNEHGARSRRNNDWIIEERNPSSEHLSWARG